MRQPKVFELGPPGWTMPLCEIDLRLGGAYRYVWRSEQDGSRMAMGGVFREVIPLERLVATEKFDDAWYPALKVVRTVCYRCCTASLMRRVPA
jgi:uncharacterized protein YndB with AHSA1/START domain